jgi:general secretion pathway protein L
MELNAMLPITDEAHVSDFVYTGVSSPGNYTFFTASLSSFLLDNLYASLEKQGIKPVMVSPAGYLAAHFFLDTLPPGGFYLMVAVCPQCLVINGVLDGTIIWLRSVARSDDVGFTAGDVGRTVMVFQQRLGIDVPVLACHLIWCDSRQEALETHLEDALAVSVVCTDTAPVAYALENSADEKGSLVSGATAFEYINAFAAVRCMGKSACIDFCRSTHGQGAFVEKYMPQLVTTGLLCLICFCMAMAGEYMEIRDLKNQSAAMDRRARLIFKETFPEITTIVDPYMQMKIQVRQALEKSGQSLDMETRFAGNTRIMDLFLGLSSRIPDTIDVEISRLVWNDGRMVFSGNTDTYDSVDKMKTAIESSPWFTDVKISNAAADKTDNRIRFKFIFQTVNPDDKASQSRGKRT